MQFNIDTSKNILNSVMNIVTYIALFIFCLMYAIIPTKIIAIILIVVCGYGAIKQKGVVINWNLLVLFEFILLAVVLEQYAFYHDGTLINWRSNIYYAIAMPLTYILGKLIVGKKGDNQDKHLFIAVVSIQTGMFIQGMLDFYSRIKTDASIEISEWPAFWEGDIMARNNFEFEFVFINAAFFVACLWKYEKKFYSYIIIFLNIVIQAIVIYYHGRQNTCLFFGNLLLIIPLYVLNLDKEKRKLYGRKICKIYGAIVLTVLLGLGVIKIISLNTSSDYYWMRDGGIFKNVRLYAIVEGLKLSIVQPQGGWLGTILQQGSTHNMALQYSQNYGTFIFILVEIFLFLALLDGFKIVLNSEINNPIKYLLFLTLVDLRIYHILDPNAYNRRYYFLPFIIFAGMARGMLEISLKRTNEETRRQRGDESVVL